MRSIASFLARNAGARSGRQTFITSTAVYFHLANANIGGIIVTKISADFSKPNAIARDGNTDSIIIIANSGRLANAAAGRNIATKRVAVSMAPNVIAHIGRLASISRVAGIIMNSMIAMKAVKTANNL